MNTVNILDFGARPDAGSPQTACIQAALDAGKGGEVVIPAGEYIIEGIRLYSGTVLKLESGAKLVGVTDPKACINFHIPTTLRYVDDPVWIEKWHLPAGRYTNALITCADAENVSIIGGEGSLIDGADCYDPEGEEGFRGPMGIRFTRCKNVTLSGYTVRRSANWAHQIDGCENIVIENVHVYEGHDGIDLHHCKNARISRCVIKTGDDCVAGYDVDGLYVDDCLFNTSCNSFRMGAKNMRISSCRFVGPGEYPHRVSGRHNSLCAFEYYSHAADKDQSENGSWLIENCEFSGIDRLIHYDFPTDWALQETVPLTDAKFMSCSIEGCVTPSVFRNRDGRKADLAFENCSFVSCPEPFVVEP